MAFATHRPTVIVKIGLIEEARTINGLSPVARMDNPSRVPRNRISTIATITMIIRIAIISYQLPPMASFAIVKIVLLANRLMVEENPMTAILMVYNPVFTIIPARIDSTPRRVCRNAVTNPDATPAPIAASSPRNGCPCKVTIAQTAQPRVKQPSVERSAIFKIENDTNSASATSA